MGIFWLMMILFLGTIIGVIIVARNSDKKFGAIVFTDEFYSNLRYFKVGDFGDVFAVTDKGTEKLYSGTPQDANKYFNNVQQNYNEWFKKNKKVGKSWKEDSTIKFS